MYVDGFVLAIPKDKVDEYRKVAQIGAAVWKEHGALEFRECVGDDLDVEGMTSFPQQMNAQRGETIVFSWIVFASRAERDRINALVMKDPRTSETGPMPFDMQRMVYGGFEVLVDG
ncbi:MAG: DUF1428 domain-containing protein [Longimicrobiales bacterium]